MDVMAIHNLIRRKVADGQLPTARPVKTWVSKGAGTACSGCERAIIAPQLEYEHLFADHPTVQFHGVCDALWRTEISLRLG